MDGRRKSMAKIVEKKKDCLRNIRGIRRAKRSDIPKVEKLVSSKTRNFFGNFNVSDLICKSYISAVMEDTNKEVVGCLCVNNFPNVPSIPPWYWKSWIRSIYKINYITPRNSLWGHFATFRQEYTVVFLIKMLEYVYEKCYFVKYVLFVIPPGLKSTDWLDSCGIAIHPQGYGNPLKLQKLFMTMRHDFSPSYKIRRAVEQDNDDVVALINRHCPRMKRIYGEFYIAELIMEKENSDRQVIVAEYCGVPVAVMILNNVVNYEMLNHAFKLEVFNGLKKPDPRDQQKIAEPDHLPRHEHSTFDSLSLVSAPEYVEHSSIALNRYLSHASRRSSETSLSIDDFELPTDVAADLEIIITGGQESEASSYGDDSECFLGTLDDQVGCVILSYTEEEFDKWARKRNFQGSFSASQNHMYHPKIPVYHGKDNAFAIEVIAAQQEHDPALRFLVEAAYECFPDKEYCILCTPSTEDAFTLLKLFCRVTPRPSSNFENELYVAHRCSVLTNLYVREATGFDCEAIQVLLERLKSPSLYPQFLESINVLDSKYRSYLFVSYSRVVGLAIVSDQNDTEYIISHYQLSTWTDMIKHGVGAHGALNFFVVSPVFEKHTRFFLQELHRLSDYTIIYYMVSPEDIADRENRLIACALGSLLPVVPTNLSECDVTSNEYWKLPDVLTRMEQPYSLYISTPLHCGLSRWEVNTKLVIVGASDVALAFLVELLYKNNPNYRVTYNNITLVSPHGICRQRTNKIREILIPSRSVLHGYYLSQLSLRTYVNIVSGVMSAINRKDKTITVNGTFLPYDLLFLTCGRQYQMPQRSKKLRGRRSEFPHNVFIVNSEVDADIALTKLNRIISESGQLRYTVIVYGHNLETLSCLAALLEFGIPSDNLVFVDPTPKDEYVYDHKVIFDDTDIEDAVMNQIKQMGIDIYAGYHFIDWSFDEEYNGVTSVAFESKHRLQELECLGMFAYSDKMISMRTFLAINRAGLVFDGGLVIGPNCQTNDPNIYAAGSITKYPRRFYADHKKHQYFNQEEIGRRLAQLVTTRLLGEICPLQSNSLFSRCTNTDKMLVPQYTDPLFVYATLPGKLYYLNVRKPGVLVPQDIAMTSDDYGQVLLSGNCKSLDRQGYFRLHLNQGNIIETITCLAKFPIQKVNLACLWGKHERLLNNLVQRFEMVLIPDLFEFFKEEWTYLIYHDYYKKLSSELNDILISLTEEEGNSLVEDICKMFETNGWKALKLNQIRDLKENFMESEYKEALMEKLLNYFGDHMLFLPMYAHPLLISIILGGYEESPFFKEL